MSINLLQAIQDRLPAMSKRQKQIAQYILLHYDKAAMMTATKLAENAQVSESTVVRFAYAMGYDGYPQLQRAMRELVHGSLTTVQRMELVPDDMDEKDVLGRVMKSDINSIRATMEGVDPEVFSRAVDAVYHARTIYLLGMRSAAPLAQYMAYYLSFLCDHVSVLMYGSQEMLDQLIRADERDVFIGISFPRYSNRTVDCLRFAREKGVKTLAITDSPVSPLVEHADYTLIARNAMFSLVDTITAPISLIQALIVAICMRKKDEASEFFNELEEMWAKNRVYARRDER